jgi:hypothetical protein
MIDNEFERIISFFVNENVIRRLLDSAYQSDNPTELDRPHANDYTQSPKLIEFLN